jgi:hypothetical protein
MLERWRQDPTAYRIRVVWGLVVLAGFLITSVASVVLSDAKFSIMVNVVMFGASLLLAVFAWVTYVWVSLWILDRVRARRLGGRVQHTKVF